MIRGMENAISFNHGPSPLARRNNPHKDKSHKDNPHKDNPHKGGCYM